MHYRFNLTIDEKKKKKQYWKKINDIFCSTDVLFLVLDYLIPSPSIARPKFRRLTYFPAKMSSLLSFKFTKQSVFFLVFFYPFVDTRSFNSDNVRFFFLKVSWFEQLSNFLLDSAVNFLANAAHSPITLRYLYFFPFFFFLALKLNFWTTDIKEITRTFSLVEVFFNENLNRNSLVYRTNTEAKKKSTESFSKSRERTKIIEHPLSSSLSLPNERVFFRRMKFYRWKKTLYLFLLFGTMNAQIMFTNEGKKKCFLQKFMISKRVSFSIVTSFATIKNTLSH